LSRVRLRQDLAAQPISSHRSYRGAIEILEIFARQLSFRHYACYCTYLNMDALTATAASGLRARMESLDMLANNLANAGAAGYKADREFYAVYADAEAAQASAAGLSPPVGVQPVIDRPWVDLSQATLQHTGSPLDLALSGPGFFAVNGPAGTLYTRNGSFQINTSGEVLTGEGHKLRLRNGGTLRIDPALPVEIGEDAWVRQQGAVLGQLEITQFSGPDVLRKAGSSYFQAANAGTESIGTQVHQGKLEASNVAPAQSAVRLVGILRQFDMLQRAIALGGDMNRKAVEEVAKPNV
jgi:flagellar basal body rod protein FlgG